MATYTRDNLRDAVLHELGVVDGHGAPDPQDAVLADDRCQQHLEYLYDQGYIDFDLEGDIPARYFVPLTWVISFRMLAPFGIVDAQGVHARNAAAGQRELV